MPTNFRYLISNVLEIYLKFLKWTNVVKLWLKLTHIFILLNQTEPKRGFRNKLN